MPNLDAARWLIGEIMPLVRERNPRVECFLVGSDMPENLRRLCKDGIVAVGHVNELAEIFDKVRLTVAPLTYGAGIKGKVVESLGAGLPCVCTPVAAEGFDFPEALQSCVAENAEGLAALICKLHEEEEANRACGQAGLEYVAAAFSNETLDAAMLRVLGPATPAPVNTTQGETNES
jgi:glycosyltransferase involved in cell wall biosynthesis